MYTVLWTNFKNGEPTDLWERCESREDVASLLIRNQLIDDADVLIFGPEAEDYLLCPEEIIESTTRLQVAELDKE